MKNLFEKAVRSGKFDEAKKYFHQIKHEEYESVLMNIAFEDDNILPYSFMCSVLLEKETAEYHYLASAICNLALCHLQGGYMTALYHARRALGLDPNDVEGKEYLLLFHNIPDRLIEKDEAIDIALQVLKEKPESKVALEIIERYKVK